jgi:hypothetical protein
VVAGISGYPYPDLRGGSGTRWGRSWDGLEAGPRIVRGATGRGRRPPAPHPPIPDPFPGGADLNGPPPAATQTFILRLWSEVREARGAVEALRGEVRHVPSRQSAWFQGLDALPAALRRVLERVDGEMNATREDEG